MSELWRQYEQITIYDDLYVMQNDHGLIKIGRSGDPEKRRRELEVSAGCRIALVLVVKDKGPREKAIHQKLKRHHRYREWFDGTDEARAAVSRLLNRREALSWPFALDDDAADAWLEQIFEWGRQRYRRDEFHRLFQRVDDLRPGVEADADFWRLFWISETGEWAGTCWSTKDGELYITGCREGADEEEIPPYSSSLNAAMSLWPADDVPPSFDGSALECCLKAMRARLLKMPRPGRRPRPRERIPKIEFRFPEDI
jgi:T5orf172 domain